MKYFIGCLIEGEVASWHANLTKIISDKFDTWKLYEKIPPHITIFYKFDSEDLKSVKNFLGGWLQNNPIPGNFVLSDFNHFDNQAVFVEAKMDQPTQEAIEALRSDLQKIIPASLEGNRLTWHPHATLAYKLTPQEINQIWDYVLSFEKPNFVIPFDNITIFRSEGDRKWVVEETLRLNSK